MTTDLPYYPPPDGTVNMRDPREWLETVRQRNGTSQYPLWLNILSVGALVGVPVAAAIAWFAHPILGAAIGAVSFFGITITGSLAEQHDGS